MADDVNHPQTVREYLNALGYKSNDHDNDVRSALHELWERIVEDGTLHEAPEPYYPRPRDDQ